MSYSFSVRAATKDEAKAQITAKFDDVLASQPVHDADRPAAETAALALVDLLIDPPEDQVIAVSISGSLSWRDEGQFTGANMSFSSAFMPKG